jgi:predicted DNA-binding transcriptional regulator AlpA
MRNALVAQKRWLSKKDLRKKIGLSNATIDRMEKDGRFPKRFAVGYRVFWWEHEINDWMESFTADSDRASTRLAP